MADRVCWIVRRAQFLTVLDFQRPALRDALITRSQSVHLSCTEYNTVGGGFASARHPLLLRQVKLAALLVFEGVQWALPTVCVPVAALDAWLVEHCSHGQFILVWSHPPRGLAGSARAADAL